MNKPYSNKALPAGTVLREWRLEEVLGVGGFGIVYKARGIYFDELVAIKEYFPSSISERDSADTVVPIDSDAEEVHALGLKKFVEEAKLLWNLSTPTRHPNIVSVRSLFEIHGTAYMVMDFEDGVSLSKMLKQGRRFNERSLWSILRPIAEGLDRAHRVGVLHRDIKPPNILINEDNRPVLIDFGSARFDTAEATSTKVTFHTPPYAAVEQYVKTYAQGPWTDIYALGVVMYECITGEKPPEVLERLHAGLGKPLSDGKWPGYGKRFLAAIDAAMTVKPTERPQSISDWLAMFGKKVGLDAVAEGDEDATRFYAPQQVEAEEIIPVVPPTADVDPKEIVATGVPADPRAVKFKRAGEETDAKRRKADAAAAAASAAGAAEAGEDLNRRRIPVLNDDADAPAKSEPAAKAGTPREAAAGAAARSKTPIYAAAGAAALVLLGVGGWALMGSGTKSNEAAVPELNTSAPAGAGVLDQPAPDVNAVGTETGNVPAAEAGQQPAAEPNALNELKKEQAKAAAAEARLQAMQKAAKAAQQRLGMPGAPTAKTAKAAPSKEITNTMSSSSGGGVSPGKIAQIDSIVDSARAMAKDVMRSGNSQNAALARNYDSYLKTLKASARGISSDKDADRLIKQANQTKAYITFLVKQSK